MQANHRKKEQERPKKSYQGYQDFEDRNRPDPIFLVIEKKKK